MSNAREIVLSDLAPDNLSTDTRRIVALGAEAIQPLIECFLNPHTRYGDMNQATIAWAIVDISKVVESPDAIQFIKRIACGDVPLTTSSGADAKRGMEQYVKHLETISPRPLKTASSDSVMATRCGNPACGMQLRYKADRAGSIVSCPGCDHPIKLPTTPAQPQDPPAAPLASAADPSFRDLPNPTDGNQLAALEAEVQKAIADLAENSRLQTVVTTPPWGWNPMEIHEQSSAADARRLAFTKIGTIMGRRQKRMMDASYRMRFTNNTTAWERDFGQPTSVLRIDFHIPGDERDGQKRWSLGVTVGKITSTRFLIWEWGQ